MSQKEILETLSRFQKAKGTEYHIRRIGVFGSTARNQLTDASDVDVVVELSEPDLYTLIGIKQDLEDLLKRSVDIVRYRESLNDFLKQRIEQEAIYV
jgi:predicted nucleotidyltransferase